MSAGITAGMRCAWGSLAQLAGILWGYLTFGPASPNYSPGLHNSGKRHSSEHLRKGRELFRGTIVWARRERLPEARPYSWLRSFKCGMVPVSMSSSTALSGIRTPLPIFT